MGRIKNKIIWPRIFTKYCLRRLRKKKNIIETCKAQNIQASCEGICLCLFVSTKNSLGDNNNRPEYTNVYRNPEMWYKVCITTFKKQLFAPKGLAIPLIVGSLICFFCLLFRKFLKNSGKQKGSCTPQIPDWDLKESYKCSMGWNLFGKLLMMVIVNVDA